MRLPFEQIIIPKTKKPENILQLDELQNIMQIKGLGNNPSFLVVGCGSSVLGLKMARKLLTLWGYRRAEDIVWIHYKHEKDIGEK